MASEKVAILTDGNFEQTINAGKPVHGTVGWLAAVRPWVLGVLLVFYVLYYLNPVLGWLWSLAVLYVCVGFRNVTHALRDIYAALKAGDLERARELLSRWRGESTSEYGETEIAKAAVPTDRTQRRRNRDNGCTAAGSRTVVIPEATAA